MVEIRYKSNSSSSLQNVRLLFSAFSARSPLRMFEMVLFVSDYTCKRNFIHSRTYHSLYIVYLCTGSIGPVFPHELAEQARDGIAIRTTANHETRLGQGRRPTGNLAVEPAVVEARAIVMEAPKPVARVTRRTAAAAAALASTGRKPMITPLKLNRASSENERRPTTSATITKKTSRMISRIRQLFHHQPNLDLKPLDRMSILLGLKKAISSVAESMSAPIHILTKKITLHTQTDTIFRLATLFQHTLVCHEKRILPIPPQSSSHTRFPFQHQFLNMSMFIHVIITHNHAFLSTFHLSKIQTLKY